MCLEGDIALMNSYVFSLQKDTQELASFGLLPLAIFIPVYISQSRGFVSHF